MAEKTTIEVRDATWQRLDALKDRGDSFDDIIRQHLPEEGNA